MIGPSCRILIVDDMMTMRKIVINMLKQIGFSQFVEAVDGEQAWEFLKSANPPFDLVLSDVNMPGFTGLELLKIVRASPKFRDLPFIILTTDGEVRLVMDAIRSNVSSFLIKPIQIESLKEKINIAATMEREKKQSG